MLIRRCSGSVRKCGSISPRQVRGKTPLVCGQNCTDASTRLAENVTAVLGTANNPMTREQVVA